MIVLCAWCEQEGKPSIIRKSSSLEHPALGWEVQSHGICEAHRDQVLAKLRLNPGITSCIPEVGGSDFAARGRRIGEGPIVFGRIYGNQQSVGLAHHMRARYSSVIGANQSDGCSQGGRIEGKSGSGLGTPTGNFKSDP